ncbi:hypothetical protein LOAG_12308 [Loa loa]|uniref:C-type lectin domain-containing protein n=2 Tax=Loa loa TaxID=7209 RepID=A0A1S0TLF6_LOALO|nr:hypothetical protein LOAG_12308 [Loa loa]EFO16198.1 hypothetical protein LOAG_12308 [Loa loa]
MIPNELDFPDLDKFWKKPDGEGDERLCRLYTKQASPFGSSVSIRSKKEFEFVKVLYRTADYSRTAMPLLIGLKYENDRFQWFDKSTFNYSDFLGYDYKSRFIDVKKGHCRRFFLYSPPTYDTRKYYVFDINCKIRFFEYRVLCRYQASNATFPVSQHPKADDYSKTKETTQFGLDYHDYWDNGNIFSSNWN